MPFSVTWDETVPGVGDDARNGYDAINKTKLGTRERIASEHDADSGTTKEWRHKFPQVATYAARNAITNTVDGWMCFRTDINAIQVKRAAASTGWDTYYGAFVGETKMFQGATSAIPKGWKLSDGALYNGFQTADLREKFIVGTKPGGGGDYDTTNPVSTPKTGGTKDHLVTKSNITEFETTESAFISTGVSVTAGTGGASAASPSFVSDTLKLGTVAGAEVRIDHRPPYYALAFIVYVGLTATE